jgi:hypothetical protein
MQLKVTVMKASHVLTLLIFILFSTALRANVKVLNAYLPQPEQIGEVRVKYMWLDIYDIALYSPMGVFDREKSFALEIIYLRNFQGEKIAERSIQEIRHQGFSNELKLEKWFNDLKLLFPNVAKGDSLVGVKDEQGVTYFYHNEVALGFISDPEFSERFFDIWLGEKSSTPKYTKQLIGS